jgi:enamine deaminase RidA (YjgF/YER057c/UK114 family)
VTRRHATSGSPFEPQVGFSRAVRVGDRIFVAGTGPIGADDADVEAQAHRCFEIVLKAIADLGGAPEHVVRTRMYLTDPADADAVARAHAYHFKEIRPAATMAAVAALVDARWKVEIEADAVVTD